MTGFSGQNLAVVRGQSLVFENLSFTVKAGETLLLTGPNGSGKTSLLRVMAGLLQPLEGALSGRPDFHWLGPENALKPELTVRENLYFLPPLPSGRGRGEGLRAALEKLGIAHLIDTEIRNLSVGQRRRVALARLFLTRKPLWLLDEPTAGLDGESAYLLSGLVREHGENGGMAVIATHEPALWQTDNALCLPGPGERKAA